LKTNRKDFLVVQVYVDDIIFGSTNMNMTHDFDKLTSCEFDMSMMGELNYFLGLQIKQITSGTIIHQWKYVKELLKRFSMEEAKEINTLIATATKLILDETGPDVEQKMYRWIIGSLLYITRSRPNIVFSVVLCARFQANPKESHLKSVKRIFRYLKEPVILGYGIQKVSDTDYAGYLVDRKNITGMAHFLGSCLITWSTKKQNSVPLSTAEAEYIVVGSYCAQLLWIKQQLLDFGVDVGCVLIFCDNTSAINIAKNPIQHKRSKHIDI